MSEFVKPKTEHVAPQDYIIRLLNTNLQKDLQDNEEICAHCQGTGMVVADRRYGLSGDPDKKAGVFPYTHQTLTFCPFCYNGVVQKCQYCGEILPKGRSKHDCEQQKAVDYAAAREKEMATLEAAETHPPEALEVGYFEGYPYNEGYFFEWDEFFDWWSSDYDADTCERPKYVWATKGVKPRIDADCLIETMTEDMYEDAPDRISQEKRQELQDFLDEWCENCGVGETYWPDMKNKIEVPWDKYEREAR